MCWERVQQFLTYRRSQAWLPSSRHRASHTETQKHVKTFVHYCCTTMYCTYCLWYGRGHFSTSISQWQSSSFRRMVWRIENRLLILEILQNKHCSCAQSDIYYVADGHCAQKSATMNTWKRLRFPWFWHRLLIRSQHVTQKLVCATRTIDGHSCTLA